MVNMDMFNILGLTKEDFIRNTNLMRNPEGTNNNNCPVCKSETRVNEQGDRYCVNYSLDYKKENKCYWHRYANGLNYWSSAEEVAIGMAKDLGINLADIKIPNE